MTWLVAAAVAFNLVCSGTEVTDGYAEGRHEKPFSIEFRIDLDRMLYCQNDCAIPLPIARADALQIWLHEKTEDTPRSYYSMSALIDRAKGTYTFSHLQFYRNDAMSKLSTDRSATCKPLPFSGFPVPPKTKF